MSSIARLLIIITFVQLLITINPSSSIDDHDHSLFHGDYSPPSPPPPSPAPLPPPLSCSDDLNGTGTLNTTCELTHDLNFTRDVYVYGEGDLFILPAVKLRCPVLGCSITVNISGEFMLGLNAEIIAGSVSVISRNASLFNGSLINVTALAGDPPEHTSGTPDGAQGSGGGHGGRGASCVMDNKKLPSDVWGGDPYAWDTLDVPASYGSKGGTTSKDEDFGGEGGGRIWIEVEDVLDARGSLLADGGDGGVKGGGGSGGSIYIKSHYM